MVRLRKMFVSGLNFKAFQADSVLADSHCNEMTCGGRGGNVSWRQDDRSIQPIYQLYLPLLAHGSGIGGVGSSER
jgi:hypothetical protein